ncbi:MAG: DUF2238 domain-containing protein [Burkholderiales bacterium]|nr:DUF2238 domain-containing protein [Burkholderiales bacterium]
MQETPQVLAQPKPNRAFHLALLVIGLAVLAWSAWHPKNYFIWFLESSPAILGAITLILLYPRFRFTDLVYVLILVHAVILMIGAHYTYAEMPWFSWLRDHFGLARNYYDRIGHIAQGFIPAMIAREVLLRCSPLQRGAWLFFLVVCFCLAFSAFYELVEWWVALASGTAADDFLATQGDVWDTQWDMFLALGGAIAAQLLLSRTHDAQLGL